jgi:hypothetical protein
MTLLSRWLRPPSHPVQPPAPPRRPTTPPRGPETIALAVEGEKVTVLVRRSARATRYTLRVDNAMRRVVLTMPSRARLAEAEAFAHRYAGWVAERMKRLADHVPFVPGALVPVRGVLHRILHRPGSRTASRLATEPDGTPAIEVGGEVAHVGRRVTDLMRKLAREDLSTAARRHAATLGVTLGRITVKDTASRWGSCSAAGDLAFSWRIIMAPPHVIDYLAAHEVAHRREMNHSARYWRVVHGLMPDYERAEVWLKRNGASLHRYGGAARRDPLDTGPQGA